MMFKKGTAKFVIIFFVILSLNVAHSQTVRNKVYTSPTQKKSAIGNTTFIQNIRYGAIPQIADDSISDRILDLYLPKKLNDSELLPVFVFIHGGGFSGGDKGMVDLCSKIAKEGFAVISINYRLTLKYKKDEKAYCSTNMANGLPKNGLFYPLLNEAIKNASDDAIMAFQWIKNNSSEYKLNTNKVAICGGSAGSITALYVAYASNQKVLPIKVVVDLWGGLEDTDMIKRNTPVLLIYHGDEDKLINVDYAYALQKRMKELGSDKSVTHILEGKGHAEYKYIAANKIAEITEFLKANL